MVKGRPRPAPQASRRGHPGRTGQLDKVEGALGVEAARLMAACSAGRYAWGCFVATADQRDQGESAGGGR